MPEQKQFGARTSRLSHFSSGRSSDVARSCARILGGFSLSFALSWGCVESPEDTFLRPPPTIIRLTPENGATLVTTRPSLSVQLDTYLDPDTVSAQSLTLRSGPTTAFARTRYEPVTRTLTLRPNTPLTPGLLYRVELDEEVAGFGTDSIIWPEWTFTVAATAEDVERATNPSPTWAEDIGPLLHEACGCHNEDAPPPPHLTRGVLELGNAEARPRRYVEPGDPGLSYLLHKALPDYPDRFGTVMPPPWSEQPLLTTEQLLLLSDWISAGTP